MCFCPLKTSLSPATPSRHNYSPQWGCTLIIWNSPFLLPRLLPVKLKFTKFGRWRFDCAVPPYGATLHGGHTGNPFRMEFHLMHIIIMSFKFNCSLSRSTHSVGTALIAACGYYSGIAIATPHQRGPNRLACPNVGLNKCLRFTGELKTSENASWMV